MQADALRIRHPRAGDEQHHHESRPRLGADLKTQLDFNCDLGEGCGDDAAIIPLLSSANIACGFHAGDAATMHDTVALCRRHGVAIGAHPSFPDREGFGRREMKVNREEVTALVLYQTGALKAFLDAEQMPLSHIKPHGALFGMAQRDEAIADGIAEAALHCGVPVIAYSDCAMSEVFTRRGVPFTCEFYADLDYDDHGRQVITKEHAPVAPEAAAAKVLRAVRDGLTRSLGGKDVKVVAESICVHSDTPGALEVAKAVHAAIADRL